MAFYVNEVYQAIQGEGIRAGTVNVFLRFANCNMRCEQAPGPKSPGGFDCDTEFTAQRKLDAAELRQYVCEVRGECRNVILTGGEPALQLSHDLFEVVLHDMYVAIETNGSVNVDEYWGNGLPLDWVTVSPKVAEHCIRQTRADEVKYVRCHGQAIPQTRVVAKHYLISPAFNGDQYCPKAIAWCKYLVAANPHWRLSFQLHKLINER